MNEYKKTDGVGKIVLKGNSVLNVDMSVSISELMKKLKRLESNMVEALGWKTAPAHNHGKGTKNTLTMYLDANGNICNSNIFNDGENVGVNTTAPEDVLHLKSTTVTTAITFENSISKSRIGLIENDLVIRQGLTQSLLYQKEISPETFGTLVSITPDAEEIVDVVLVVGGTRDYTGRIDTDVIRTQRIDISGALQMLHTIKSTDDTDKFAVLNSEGYLQYRTGDEIRSDIGAASSSHDHGKGTVNALLKYTDAEGNSGDSIISADGVEATVKGHFTALGGIYSRTNRTVSLNDINATNGSTTAWNVAATARFTENNVTIALGSSGTLNDYRAYIQAGNYSTSYAASLASLLLNPWGGKVGINTLAPDASFTVAGGGHITGKLDVDGELKASKIYINTRPTHDYFTLALSNLATQYYYALYGSMTYNMNSYYDGVNTRYASSAGASQLAQAAGTMALKVAPAGVAGEVLTWINSLSLQADGSLKAGVIPAATTDTDKFLISDSGVIKHRTGAQVLADIGASPYAIGEFTLTIMGGTGSCVARYTKIGRCVVITVPATIFTDVGNTSFVLQGIPVELRAQKDRVDVPINCFSDSQSCRNDVFIRLISDDSISIESGTLWSGTGRSNEHFDFMYII